MRHHLRQRQPVHLLRIAASDGSAARLSCRSGHSDLPILIH